MYLNFCVTLLLPNNGVIRSSDCDKYSETGGFSDSVSSLDNQMSDNDNDLFRCLDISQRSLGAACARYDNVY